MSPSDIPSSNDAPPFGGIGKFGPQSGAPSYPKFEAPAAPLPGSAIDEVADETEQGSDVVSRGLRFHDILKGNDPA